MKKVEIPIEFYEDETGKGKARPKDLTKWKAKSKAEVLKEVGETKPVFDDKITVWKVNPCYVCIGNDCFWDPNC